VIIDNESLINSINFYYMDKITEIINELEKNQNPKNLEGMQRYGIRFENAYGVNIPVLRNLAKKYKHDHELALRLWETKIHEAMIMAFLIDDPAKVTKKQMQNWVKDFKSWDICDGCCSNLFDKTPWAYEYALKWTGNKSEFIKRAGFVMAAVLSVHDLKAEDDKFLRFLPIIERESTDERNFVKKAVNWALRQIGKRNTFLYKKAIKTAKRIKAIDSKSAKWIATDALREFETETTKKIVALREKRLKR